MHSNIVLTAPANLSIRACASSGVCSRRSLVPMLGQLRPSKSIGGLRVYGLAGRLTVTGGEAGGSSSRPSRAGSLSETCPSVRSLVVSDRSTAVFLPYVDLIDELKFSRSLARCDPCRGEVPLTRYDGRAFGLGPGKGGEFMTG